MKFTRLHKLAWVANLAARARTASFSIDAFDWTSVQPAASLTFTDCYNATHRCARLQVPLDWLHPDNNEVLPIVTIAVIIRPAAVDEHDPTFGGTIITNPGGPGGSGVGLALGWGEKLQKMADSESKKYAIMSFDPRGVGLTIPSADCHNDEFARATWKFENRAIGPLDEDSVAAVRHKTARAAAFGRLCDEAGGEHGIYRFMSTTSVARDMVKIIDDLDELLQTTKSDRLGRIELRSVRKPARLLYWGFSYGSALGQYFASIYPGRVGRMLLDGIVDVDDYSKADGLSNMGDTQETLGYLWTSCYSARTKCALYRANDEKPSDIEKRFRTFLAQLEQEPAPYVANKTVVAITKYDILNVIFQSLYDPLTFFCPVAEALNESMQGNFTSLYSRLQLPDNNASGPPSSYTWIRDAMVAVSCGDAISRSNVSITEIIEHIKLSKKDSPDFGPEWTRHLYEYRGWAARPKYRFDGPWGMEPADSAEVEGRPAAPIFFITSKADPVTPRRNAFAMAKRYAGSRVLVQNSVGHCASAWPSKCSAQHIRRYWDKGVLPEEGTTCGAECSPFEECPEVDELISHTQFVG